MYTLASALNAAPSFSILFAAPCLTRLVAVDTVCPLLRFPQLDLLSQSRSQCGHAKVIASRYNSCSHSSRYGRIRRSCSAQHSVHFVQISADHQTHPLCASRRDIGLLTMPEPPFSMHAPRTHPPLIHLHGRRAQPLQYERRMDSPAPL